MARDEFSKKVKDTLADRVGHRCSNPGCRQPTTGPGDTPEMVVRTGDAAHITAAAAEGPRYDPALSEEQRASSENGIWLCQPCARRIDREVSTHSSTLLQEWKQLAESRAREARDGRGAAAQPFPCPHCNDDKRADLDRLGQLDRGKRADRSARTVAEQQQALRRDLANSGMTGSGIEIAGMTRIQEEHARAILSGVVEAAAGIFRRLCGVHREQHYRQVLDEIRESAAASERVAIERVREQLARAGVGGVDIAEARLRSTYAAMQRTALRDLEETRLRAATAPWA